MAITITLNGSPAVERTAALGPGGTWDARAPRHLRKAYQSIDDGLGWVAWQKHLAERSLKPCGKLAPRGQSPLLWELTAFLPDETIKLVEQLSEVRAARHNLDEFALAWLEAPPTGRTMALAVECVAWSQALPRLTSCLSESTWWRLLNSLATDAATAAWHTADPLASLISSGELPLTLAYLFPELTACHALGQSARSAITHAACELWDEQGIPRSKHLGWLRPLLACWTRCRALGEGLREGWCDRPVARMYPRVIEHALRLSRADGSMPLADNNSAWQPELVVAVARLAADSTTRQVAKLATAGRKSTRRVAGSPSPALESEQAGLALLRPDWQSDAPRLLAAYDGDRLESELSLGGHLAWSGAWQLDVRLNGRALMPRGHWEQVCWVTDDEVDYLELSLEFHEELVVERHLLMGRKDRFCLVADAVLGIGEAEIEYRTVLPLTSEVRFAPETESHEGTLVMRGKPRARVLPLQLPEWRAGSGSGVLRQTDQGLELRQQAIGQSLFAPLFFDLDPRRLRKQLTWRSLTVAQERQVLPADSAVGYRVQIGDAQWLVYRSLSTPDVRSVLGVNLMHEFLVAEFLPTGKIKRLLEIEPA